MPDLKKYFSVGDKVQIEFVDLTGHKHDYISQIDKIIDNEHLNVLIPISKNQIVYLKTDTILRMVSAREDAVFEVNTRIADKLFGEIPLLKLQIISDIKKTQRRNFFRLKLLGDIEIQKVIDLKERSFGERFKGYMLDISGGGLMFSSTVLLQEKELVELTLNLNNKKLVLFGLIVRRVYCNNPKAPYNYGVRFERITDFERNEITKFIFEEQRKMIKKGLI